MTYDQDHIGDGVQLKIDNTATIDLMIIMPRESLQSAH